MKRLLIFLGLGTAFAACCAAPAILSLLAIGAAGTAWLSARLALLLAAAWVLAALAIAIARHRKSKLGKTGAWECGGIQKEQS